MTHLEANVDRFTGLSEIYHQARPRPAVELHALLPPMVRTNLHIPDGQKLKRIVDLGSGTGLSTLAWKDYAEEIIGVEPNKEMMKTAQSYCSDFNHIQFLERFSIDTGIEDSSADLVLCSQSLHWMEPEGTFKEVARILKKGGIFAAFDCDWPPTTKDWRADQAYITFEKQVKKLGKKSLYLTR